MYEAGNGHEFRFHKVGLMFDEWVVHGQPTARFGTAKKTALVCIGGTKTSMCLLHEILLE